MKTIYWYKIISNVDLNIGRGVQNLPLFVKAYSMLNATSKAIEYWSKKTHDGCVRKETPTFYNLISVTENCNP